MKKIFGFFLTLLAGLALGQNAGLRVAHLSPDAPEVDVWVNGSRLEVLSKLAFKAVSDYQSLPAGEVTVWLVPTGKTEPRVMEARLRLEAGKRYTLAATGLLAQLRGILLEDAAASPAGGQASLRLVHAVPGFPAVDVRVGGGSGSLVAQNLSFGQAGAYQGLGSGGLSLVLFATGDTTRGIPLPSLRLESGKSYTLFLSGQYSHRAENFGLAFVLVEER